MMNRLGALLGAALMLTPSLAQAQSNYPSAGGATVPTAVQMCLNSSGVAVPVSGGTCANPAQVAGAVTVDTSLLATAANQTSPLAPVAPATATATKSMLGGCQATSAAINPTTGQQAAIDCDLNNNLLVSAGGAPNLAIAQVSIATSDTLAVAARALRRSVTIQQITGTQNVFCNQTTATTANGVVLPATVGASFTFNTTSAIRCIAVTGAQTVAVVETF